MLELVDVGVQIPIEKIRESVQKVRKETAAQGIQDLHESMKQHGQIHPVSLLQDGDTLELINGHRRFTAARTGSMSHLRANIYRVPAGREDEKELLVQQHLYAANMAEPLVPVERARMFAQLMKDFDWDVEKVASCFEGETPETVAETLKFLDIDDEVLDIVAANPGKFTAAHLQVLADYASTAKKHAWRMKPEEQKRVAEELVAQTDKQMVNDPRKLEAHIKSVVKARRDKDKAKRASNRKVQTDPVKELFKAVEAVERAAKALVAVEPGSVAGIDAGDKGAVLKRLYDVVEELNNFNEGFASRAVVRKAAS